VRHRQHQDVTAIPQALAQGRNDKHPPGREDCQIGVDLARADVAEDALVHRGTLATSGCRIAS
jgi:hypothetical protein